MNMHWTGRLAAFAAAAALVAAGCGSDDASTPPTTASPTSTAATTTATAGSVGTTAEVPPTSTAEPATTSEAPTVDTTRVVSTDMTTTDVLLALGVTPVGSVVYQAVAGNDGAYPSYLADGTGDVTSLGVQTPNLEIVATLAPDHIVGFGRTIEDLRPQLEAIAPVLAVDSTTNDWRAWTTDIAAELGIPDAADGVLARYEARIAELRPSVEGRSIAIVRPRADGVLVYGPNSLAGRIMTDLGMTVVAPPIEDGKTSVSISLEEIGSIVADELVVFTFNWDGPIQELLAQPLWASLAPIAEGRAVVVEGSAWNVPGPLGVLRVIDEAEAGLVPT